MYGKYVLAAHTHTYEQTHTHTRTRQPHKYFIKYVLCPIYDVFVTLHSHKYGKKNILMMRLLVSSKYLAIEPIRFTFSAIVERGEGTVFNFNILIRIRSAVHTFAHCRLCLRHVPQLNAD